MQTALQLKLRMTPVSLPDRNDFLGMAEAHFRELNPRFEPANDWQGHYFNGILANRNMFLRWIELDSKRVGFILFGIENHRFLPRQTGCIFELYVGPSFRRNSIARECAAAAIRELQSHSVSKVELQIMNGNIAAERLWRSLSFEKFSERWILKDPS